MLNEGSPPRVTIRLRSRRVAYSLALNPGLAIGEAYMDGLLMVEEGTIYDFLEVLARNCPPGSHRWLAFLERASRGLKQRNRLGRATRNVAYHYDLSGELYNLPGHRVRRRPLHGRRRADSGFGTDRQPAGVRHRQLAELPPPLRNKTPPIQAIPELVLPTVASTTPSVVSDHLACPVRRAS